MNKHLTTDQSWRVHKRNSVVNERGVVPLLMQEKAAYESGPG